MLWYLLKRLFSTREDLILSEYPSLWNPSYQAPTIPDWKAWRGPHPILRVPDDVLRQIFLHAAPSFHLMEYKRTRSSPWTLSYVCRRWRHIAIYTVELWSLIWMDTEWSMSDGTVRLLELQLRRAQDCKLRIWYRTCNYWRTGDDSPPYFTPDFTRYLRALRPTTRRWKVLAISGDISELDLRLIMGFQLDALEEIRWDDPPRDGDSHRTLDFQFAPCLRRLVLRDQNKTEMLFPWKQITTLATYSPRSGDLVQCESLQNLELDYASVDDVEPPVPREMPSLLRLSLVDNKRTKTDFLHQIPGLESHYLHCSYIPNVFEQIDAPQLHTLKLSHALQYPQIRDSSRITHLALVDPRSGTDSMGPATVRFLHTLPNLTMFNFAIPDSEAGAEDLYGVVKSLRVTTNTVLLPRLTHLRLINVLRRINENSFPEFEIEAFQDILDIGATRANAGARCAALREMVLVGTGDVCFDWFKYRMRLHLPGREIDENVKVVFTEVELDDAFHFAGGLAGKDFGMMSLL